MDIDSLRKQVQQKFNPLQKIEEPLSESVVKSESEVSSEPMSMLQQALQNRIQSEQATIRISEADRKRLRKQVDGNVDPKLMNRLLRGHD